MNSYQMPLFFTMSGFLFSKAYIQKNGQLKLTNIKNQIINLVLLYVILCWVMGIFKIILSGYVNNEVNSINLCFMRGKYRKIYAWNLI